MWIARPPTGFKIVESDDALEAYLFNLNSCPWLKGGMKFGADSISGPLTINNTQ